MAGKQDSGVGGQERGPFREGLRSVGTQSEGSHAGIKVQGMPPWVRSIFHNAERRGNRRERFSLGDLRSGGAAGRHLQHGILLRTYL